MRDVFDIWVRQVASQVSKKLLSLTIATTLSVMQAVRSQEEEKERKRISTKKVTFCEPIDEGTSSDETSSSRVERQTRHAVCWSLK